MTITLKNGTELVEAPPKQRSQDKSVRVFEQKSYKGESN